MVKTSRAICLTLLALAAACGGERAPEASLRALITSRTLGLAYLEENRLEEAEQEFQRLTELAPDEPLGHANLGLVYLRQGHFEEAERSIARAKRLAPDDAEIRLLLAKVYELTERPEAARRELLEALEAAPDDLEGLYALAELEADLESAAGRRAEYLERILERAPGNVPVRLQLAELALRAGDADGALAHMEDLRQRVPEFPAQSTEFFDRAMSSMRSGNAEAARTPFAMFHNFMRVTPVYQAGLQNVRGPGGTLIGLPVVTLAQDLGLGERAQEEILAALKFTDATEVVGLAGVALSLSHGRAGLDVADYDGDTDPDIFVAAGNVARWLRNDVAAFADATAAAGMMAAVGARDAVFFDYDNDGKLDLFVIGSEGGTLLRNEGDGRFRDVTRTARLAGMPAGYTTLAVDGDHDGDLDLFVGAAGTPRLYRNNGDRTFSEVAAPWGLAVPGLEVVDAAFGDLDSDDDIDLIVADAGGSLTMFRNGRAGRFERVTGNGVEHAVGVTALDVADYDNDGFLDVLAVAGSAVRHTLLRNKGDGTFEPDGRPAAMLKALGGVAAQDVAAFDFDNDGWQDFLVAGSDSQGRGLHLFRNAGPGQFDDMSQLFAAEIPPVATVEVFDHGADGDLDILALGTDGRLRLLRNDGGDANRYVKVQLVGLGAGSGKNNHFGIGAKLEVRAGQLYQMRVVTGPVTHFGLGQRRKADVLRIVWSNGVPQNLFYPGSDQDLIEEQVLKGSCAFLYTWDGERYRFVTDLMWRSAIGMPLGIMAEGKGSGMMYAPAQASKEYVRVPPDALKPRASRLRLQLTEELWEVAYVDEVKLVAVDHPADAEIYVDERFVPPGPARLELHWVRGKRTPIAATDHDGRDVLTEIVAHDFRHVTGFNPGPYQGIAELHDLVLDFGELGPSDSVRLYLKGWIFPSDASINVAVSQSDSVSIVAPSLAIEDARGRWRTAVEQLGFPAGKNKTVITDLTGKLRPGDRRIRIRTNMTVYWDQAFVTVGETGGEARLTTLAPQAADLHTRGLSREYRKGGRYGPQWFDYDSVTTAPRWRPIEGRFTRFGDVRELLQASDDRYVVMAPGDETTVEFAADLPLLPAGWTRTFLIYTDGWIKDADLNTATGNTVEPLPFHAMSEYPYGTTEAHPHPGFVREYLTRLVTRYDW
jgi:tetratricopeptide (TPR) repeat protein